MSDAGCCLHHLQCSTIISWRACCTVCTVCFWLRRLCMLYALASPIRGTLWMPLDSARSLMCVVLKCFYVLYRITEGVCFHIRSSQMVPGSVRVSPHCILEASAITQHSRYTNRAATNHTIRFHDKNLASLNKTKINASIHIVNHANKLANKIAHVLYVL